jgi:hypothetical protein
MTAFAEYRKLDVASAPAPLVHNNCVRFGTQSYFDCGTSPVLSMGGVAPYTLEAWIKPRSVTGGFIVGKLAEGSLSIVKGRLLAGRNVGERGVGSTAIHSTTVLEAGRWYHVATTFDGTSMSLYVNGRREVTTRPFTRLNACPGEATLIGAQKYRERPANFFLGLIHEVRIWNVWRTPDQLFRSMKDVEPASPGLVAHYAFWNVSGERDRLPASGQTGDFMWQGKGLRPTLLT